jgi:hypothetical protein
MDKDSAPKSLDKGSQNDASGIFGVFVLAGPLCPSQISVVLLMSLKRVDAALSHLRMCNLVSPTDIPHIVPPLEASEISWRITFVGKQDPNSEREAS